MQREKNIQGEFKINKLSRKEKELVIAIKQYVEDNGYPPTYRELRDLVGLKSISTVSGHLERLKAKGYVSYISGSARTLSINKELIEV